MVYAKSFRKRIAAFLVFILLAVISSRLTGSQLVQWPVAAGGNGHFYEVVPVPAGITWGNAGLAATNRGGYLATITSTEENAFVFNLAGQDPTVWYSEDRIQFGGQANRSSAWNDVGQNTVNFTRGFAVEYDQHPNAIALSIVRKDIDEIQLSWTSRLNVTYTIEWTEDLGGQWIFLSTVFGNGATVTVDDFLAGRRRFYRSSVAQ